VFLLVILLVLSGCSLKIQTPYSPSILLDGSGALFVGDFRYLPSERNEGALKKNQVDTFSGLTPIYTEADVSEVVKKALSKELKFIGYSLNPSSSKLIGGEIIEFSCDYIGFAKVDFKTKINFKIIKTDGATIEGIYSKTHEGNVRADKTLGGPEHIYGSLSKAIESFLVDAKASGLL
jgi:hypothetical protein